MRRVYWVMSAILFMLEATVLFCLKHPNVSEEYKRYYITRQDKCWGCNIEHFPQLKDLSGLGYISVYGHKDWFALGFLDGGWSDVEADHVWMTWKNARLKLGVPAGSTGTLVLDQMGFLPFADSRKTVKIYIDKNLATTITFTLEKNRQQVQIPFRHEIGDFMEVKLVDDDLRSPASLGISGDGLTLSTVLYGFRVDGRRAP